MNVEYVFRVCGENARNSLLVEFHCQHDNGHENECESDVRKGMLLRHCGIACTNFTSNVCRCDKLNAKRNHVDESDDVDDSHLSCQMVWT